jgi:AcrR family transcriptional regulator
MKKRKYRQKARADQARETRQQIVEAAVKLHEELGPASTSIKAIAEEAGVQRLTVYRHFPTDEAIFEACTAHWLSQHPPPVVADDNDPVARTKKTLVAVYRYYRQNERMWTVAYRDVEELPALQGPMNQVEAYFDGLFEQLMQAWPAADKTQHFAPSLRHALRFSTWRSLKMQKLSDKKIIELVMAWLR